MVTRPQLVPLGDVITLQRGFDLPAHQRKPGKVPVISTGGVTGYHDQKAATGPGVVIRRYGAADHAFYVEGDYWPHNTTLWVRDFKGNHERFVYYLLESIDFSAHATKTGIPGVNMTFAQRLGNRITGIAPRTRA